MSVWLPSLLLSEESASPEGVSVSLLTLPPQSPQTNKLALVSAPKLGGSCMLAFFQGKEAASSLSCAPLGQGGSWQGRLPGVQLGSTATSPIRKQLVFAQVLTVSLVEAPVDSELVRSAQGIPQGAGTPPTDRADQPPGHVDGGSPSSWPMCPHCAA